MRVSLRFLSGLSSRLVLLLLVWIGLVSLAGCSGMGPLSLLTGGGPNVAANTQLGQQNTQTIGSSETVKTDIKDVQGDVVQSNDKQSVKADSVETVIVNEYPVWLILAFVVAVFLDSPLRMIQDLLRIFTRKRD